MTQTYYVGLDVHKETISIAHALGGSREESTYHGQCSGSIAAVTKALQKLAEKLKVEFGDLKVCYEAGPTGFVIARHLIKKEIGSGNAFQHFLKEFNHREAVPTANLQKLGTTKAYSWLVVFT